MLWAMDFQELRATSADPRYVTEEIRSPVYRLDFWDRNRDSDEFRLENAVSLTLTPFTAGTHTRDK